MFCFDLKGGSFSCEVLERDAQGRILFLYETTSCITNNWEKAYVICQRLESATVYFYEDMCYLFATDSVGLEELKDKNDWSKPLNNEKMAKRDFNVSADLFLMTNAKLELAKITEACCQELGIQKEHIGSPLFLDINEYNQEMYWLVVKESNMNANYCIIVDTDYELEYTGIEKSIYWEQIQSFKQKIRAKR